MLKVPFKVLIFREDFDTVKYLTVWQYTVKSSQIQTSKQNGKYSQSGISRGKYSQSGICLFVKISVILFSDTPENLSRGKTCRF